MNWRGWWPFNRRGQSATDTVSAADVILFSSRIDESGILGAVEASVSLWEHAVAGAVMASPYPVDVATRQSLTREYLLLGQAVRRVDVIDGRLRLVPARCQHVYGSSPDPSSWHYQLDVPVPNGTRSARYSADRALHWRRSLSSSRSWDGRSVLADCPALEAVASAVESSLVGEHRLPVQRLLGIEVRWRENNDKRALAENALWERLNLPEDGQTLAVRWDREQQPERPVRLGADPTDASVLLRDQLRRDVAAAFGIAPASSWVRAGPRRPSGKSAPCVVAKPRAAGPRRDGRRVVARLRRRRDVHPAAG